MLMYGHGGTVNVKNSSHQIGGEARKMRMKYLHPEISGNFTMSGSEISWKKIQLQEAADYKL